MRTIEQAIQKNPFNPLLGLVVGIKKCKKCGIYFIEKEDYCIHQTEKLLKMVAEKEISIEELKGILKFFRIK